MFLFLTDINSTGNCLHNWFEAQDRCYGHGLTKEEDKSHQPYWTGVYRRMTPWIKILGPQFIVFSIHSVFYQNNMYMHT